MKKRTLNTKNEFFNSVSVKDKATIVKFINELGYLEPRDLFSHIVECGIAKRYYFSRPCLKEVIEHYEQSCSKK